MPYFENKMIALIERTMLNLRSCLYEKLGELKVEAWTTKEPLSYEHRLEGEYKKLSIGECWGELFDCAWFHFTADITPDIAKMTAGKPVALLIDVSGEGCIVDENGNPKQGLTCIFNENMSQNIIGSNGKRIYHMFDSVVGGEKIDIWMDAGCNNPLGGYNNGGKLEFAHIVSVDNKKIELFYDMQVLYDLVSIHSFLNEPTYCLEETSVRRKRILNKLYEASCMLRTFSVEEVSAATELLKPELAKKNGDSDITVSAIGHAHLDLAWLWPIRETIRKGARTFSTALCMMEKYPWYVFGASQPQLYEWIKKQYPHLYEKVHQRIKEGRWEAQGAMWVEPDTNVTSGESLVRQILYGMKFYEEEFGVTVKSLWLPDTFGYSGALPQILKKSGIDYFMTQKMCWSSHNKFPHHTFWWEGIDGSRVLAHLLPENTYNGAMSPFAIKKSMDNYIDSYVSENFLMLYGIGDGGGGPGEEYLERAERLMNLSGLCPVVHETSDKFFEKLAKNSEKYHIWRGEMYLENHRGTYTTQSFNKYYNRKMEIALREAEFAASLDGGFTEEEKSKIDKIWKNVLLYQFHDILPGSSIKRVYDECKERYPKLLEKANTIRDNHYNNLSLCTKGTTYFNSLCWDRCFWIKDKNGEYKVLSVPALGYASEDLAIARTTDLNCGELWIENELLRVEFDTDGAVLSIYDKKNNREVLSGKAAVLRVYHESDADCWNIDCSYIDSKYECFELVNQKTCIDGVAAFMKQTYKYGKSFIEMEISLEAESPLVDFAIEADWYADSKMLRIGFPLSVSSDTATSEIQFGKIKRPTNDNTTWQQAQIETVGQRWVDISRTDYGVALLNDCKYGYRLTSNCIDVNLLRSQDWPGELADRGHHSIKLALYPHIGDEMIGNVQKMAIEYNIKPCSYVGNGEKIMEDSFVKLEGDAIIDTLKPSEDDRGLIARIYEPYGKEQNIELTLPFGYTKAFTTDLRENNPEDLIIENNKIKLLLKPFEITTVKFER